MTIPRLPPERMPGWPRWLTEDLAAAYVGVGVSLFRDEVKAGIWPPAWRRGKNGGLLTWDRDALDRARNEALNPASEAKKRMLGRLNEDAQGADTIPA